MSSDMWVKSGFDWSTYHRRLCFIMQPEREKETVVGRWPCWEEKHNNILQMLQTQVAYVNVQYCQSARTQRRYGVQVLVE